MKKCHFCGKELKDTAKFCGGCGKQQVSENASQNICPACKNPLRLGAKFCGKCGTSLQTAYANEVTAQNNQEVSSNSKDVALSEYTGNVGGYLYWNIQQGQLAVKIDADLLASYGGKVRGIDIQEGVKALLFIHGKLIGQLDSGHYPFKDLQDELPADETPGVVRRFIDRIGAFCVSLVDKEKAEEMRRNASRIPFCFVLIRTHEFPLVFNFNNATTANIRSDVGLHLLCKISDINAFYNNLLVDSKFVAFETFAKRLSPLFFTKVNQALSAVSPNAVSNNIELQKSLLPVLRETVAQIYPFCTVSNIIQLTADHAELENIRVMQEELYIAEQQLIELSKRNDFFNRRQIVVNEQELMELRTSGDQDLAKSRLTAYYAAKNEKIYEEMALTEDEKEKFDLMLSAQKKLREAKSAEEIAVAMHEFRKSGLLRDQEIETLQHKIAQDAKLRDLDDAQVLAMATVQNQMALDQQKLEWEIQIGNKRIQNQFDRQRIEDAYHDEKRDKEYAFTDQRREKDADFSDSRRNADAAFEDDRRRSTIDLDDLEMQKQLDRLARAQSIRQQREDAEHQREMEVADAARRHELDTQRLAQEAEKAKLDAANEEKRIYAGMTFEQIMAANPNISPEAAQALAKKFEAEAAASMAQANIAQNDKTAQMAIDQRDQMMAFMQQQMAMMKDISMAGINAGGGHQQAMLDAKQAELDRTRADASANSDRFVDGMKTTIDAVSNMNRPVISQPQSVLQSSPQVQYAAVLTSGQAKKCHKCGAPVELGDKCCCECGTEL
ncbi:MAG: zinc ribbon domain-containing protein [Lentisphaeria bacterium]|nr:zinc ribbon domain-containing protein [Lentisphaeria bacterium]